MKIQILLLVTAALFTLTLSAQKTSDLFMPKEYKRAYNNGSRSLDGTPGENYFQNRTDYDIKAEFFPDTKMLTGSEVITFKNNSPDTLSWIYINLYQNIFKKGETRDSYIDPKNIHDGVEIKQLKINDSIIDAGEMVFYSTLLACRVPDKIFPLSSTKIEIKWQLKTPVTGMFRIGTYDTSSFFVGYWYPKMNVYDDISGWNTFGYNGNAEFYSDYGNFEVEITVPSNYITWSSGPLQNGDEIFHDKYIKRINEAAISDEIIPIISKEDRLANTITKSREKHIWKFKAENLPDFAFCLSDKYVWDATSLQIGDERIIINAVYNPRSKNFQTVAEICKKSIEYYSNTAPAIPFPYSQFTAFNGEKNGAEFPGMFNDQEEASEMGTLFVTTHEVAHTYFPFYVGVNEQEYSWMDETLATMIGASALADQMGTGEAIIMKEVAKRYHDQSAKLGVDIPMMTGTHSLGDFTSGFVTYIRPTAAFSMLFDYLGKEKFYQILREFSKNWKGKHPIPYDLFHAFNKGAGEDLGWFWKPWFFELGYADLGIGNIKYSADHTIIEIENQGSFPVPINLTVKFKDGRTIEVNQKMDAWKSGNRSIKIKIAKGDIGEIILDMDLPETYYDNNRKIF